METVDSLLSSQLLFRDSFDFESALLALLLSFVLGQLIAWVYIWTHTGLSYSRSFVQSLVVLTVIVALVMVVIGNSIVTAFGLIGALAIVRFRNVLKDTRDTVFVFSCLVVGMGIGSFRFGPAILGAVSLCLIMIYLRITGFGSRTRHDGLIRFRVEEDPKLLEQIGGILQRHCRALSLVSTRRPALGSPSEYAYAVSFRDPRRNSELLHDLGELAGMKELSLSIHEDEQEI